MKVFFEIYYQDFTEAAQHYLCKKFKTTPEKEKLNTFPLVILTRELEEKEED